MYKKALKSPKSIKKIYQSDSGGPFGTKVAKRALVWTILGGFGDQRTPKRPHRSPKEPKGTPKGAHRSPQEPQRLSKVSQKRHRETPKCHP